ncbi:hypothetical protein Q6348_03560 [Isoptericola sp. b441]|uniref:Uncharacterized protein n=1 Tax=Actinotalea lenta TaxID=3064654 RepID=A0ABT9D7Q8_9CELL|nr:hypothetical protein [Isoptericola sp. b441]MDO8106269.1 hypothetical protein [Isoptericola sp. b441]
MPVPLDPGATETAHVLVLAEDVLPEELEVLATSRFTAAHWEHPPAAPDPRTRVPSLRLSRLSTLDGPYRMDRDVRARLGLPAAGVQGYLLRGPHERGEAPWPEAGDRDGLGRAFPDGLPVRDELRTVTWLVAAARRLGGAVRVAGSGVVLVPDPTQAVDLTVWSDIWLDPQACLVVVRQALPRAQLDLGREWAGPPPEAGRVPAQGTQDMDPEERAALHVAAEERDLQVLAHPAHRSSYGLLADLDADGMLAVGVEAVEEVPVVLAGVPWTEGGAIAYRVTWEPDDLAVLGQERPAVEHRVARSRTAPLVNAVTRALHTAVAGEITDMMDFVVDPADL